MVLSQVQGTWPPLAWVPPVFSLGPSLPLLCSACCLPPHVHPPLLTARLIKKQAGLHGNRETAEKWQLNAAAPHLISTLALTEQIMGNNTPLCCGEMKCFSRRLSCCRDLFVTVPAEIFLPFCLSLSVISSFPPSPFLFLSVSELTPSFAFCYFFLFLLPCFSSSPFLFSFTFSVVFCSFFHYNGFLVPGVGACCV